MNYKDEELGIDDALLERCGIAEWIRDNEPPKPLQEVSIDDFWFYFHQYGARQVGYYQIKLGDGDPCVRGSHVMVYFDRIFILTEVYNHKQNKRETKCYRAGCVHQYHSKILNARNGDSEATCSICGYSYKYNCGD